MATGLARSFDYRKIYASGGTIVADSLNSRSDKQVIVSITLTVLSSNNREAILFSSEVSGPLSAGIYAYYMIYYPTKWWVVVASKMLSFA